MHKTISILGVLSLCAALDAFAANPILGEVEMKAASKIERNAGVWLDGQYVGFVRDIEGKGKLVMVPGEHRLLIKLVGYQDVASTIVLDPGEHTEYRVSMVQASNVSYPEKDETARVRFSVEPEDAAIFVDGAFVGHVDRFNGHAGLRLASGTYGITVALPGYQAFDTKLSVRAGQRYELKTKLLEGDFNDQAGELTAETDVATPSSSDAEL